MSRSNKLGERPTLRELVSEYLDPRVRNGIAVQCHFCNGQKFRRSALRGDDVTQLLLMRYPVRCLDCHRRQGASFAVAGTSMSSRTRLGRRRHSNAPRNYEESGEMMARGVER